jgi:hypothetical protein
MKKLLLLFILMLLPLLASAQIVSDVQNSGCLNETHQATYEDSFYSYHPFLKEGKTWNYQEYYHNIWDNEQWTKSVSYVINGTTEIGGRTYYKLYRICEDENKYYCALREEDRKVWQYISDTGDQLLYDFGMSVGDSYMLTYTPFNYQLNYQLNAIKPMKFHNDQLLNVLYYDIFEIIDEDATNPANFINHIASAPIVEGVGCEEGWNIMELFAVQPSNGIIYKESFLSCYEDGKCIFTANDFNNLNNPNSAEYIAYRPFIEDGKVWKVGYSTSFLDNIVKMVGYYYFDGDTIIDGKTCKQMMYQQFVSPDFSDDYWTSGPSISKVGAWYEDNQKVYFYDELKHSMELKYDFSLSANDTLQLTDWYSPFIIGPKQTGEIEGFKGVYRDIMICGDEGQSFHSTFWLEGVGDIQGPTRNPYDPILGYLVPEFLMSCAVDDEVIYLNDKYEDGATPEGAMKNRFDFTHTIKTKPKAPRKNGDGDAEASGKQSLYGEYNELQLGINLDPLDDAYQVSITNELGILVYEKVVNAGSIIGLNIDISAYAKGRYTVTIENSSESFTGEFEVQTVGINSIIDKKEETRTAIYNLHGQRISTMQKGLNIVNGKKIYVK